MTHARPPGGPSDAAPAAGPATPADAADPAAPAPAAADADADADDLDPRRELARERVRSREAAADARLAEREALETARRLRKVTQQLNVERGRIADLRRRRALRFADDLAGRRRMVEAVVARLRRRLRRMPPPAAPIIRPARRVAPDTDPRRLAAHYRAALSGSLDRPDGPDGPLRVTLVEPPEVDAGAGARLGSVADALRTRGAIVSRERAPTASQPLDPATDVVVVADDGVDPLTLPAGPIRVSWSRTGAGATAGRSEWDIALPDDVDPGPALLDHLERWLGATRVSIRTPTGSAARAEAWGDTYFARDLRTALRAAGYPTRIHFYDAWDDPAVGHDDVVIDLVGVYEPATRPGAVRVLWQISHPELASRELYGRYDLVYVASDRFAALMAEETGVPVRALHQATDPDRFRPGLPGPANELLIVANWRPHRRIVSDLLPTGHRVSIHGRGWTSELVGPGPELGEPVTNDELGGYYASAAILLNDHAPGMRREGFLSNRLYDAAACGTLVISDAVDGLEAEFDGGVLSYRDRRELHALIDRCLADPAGRAATAERARRAVLERHTFAHRAATLIDAIQPVLASTGARSA